MERPCCPDGIPPWTTESLELCTPQSFQKIRPHSCWMAGCLLNGEMASSSPCTKEKVWKTACGSYWLIALLSVPGKVFPHLLFAHIQPVLLTTCMPQLPEFTPGSRSTIAAIPALRLLSELHQKTLCSKGIPNILLHLKEDLYQNTGACVRVGGKLLLRFKLTSSVRHGCVLAPAMFCVTLDCQAIILMNITSKGICSDLDISRIEQFSGILPSSNFYLIFAALEVQTVWWPLLIFFLDVLLFSWCVLFLFWARLN